MNAEHRKEQEEAHRRDFLNDWNFVLLPVALDLDYTDPEDLKRIKEGAWESRLADDALERLSPPT